MALTDFYIGLCLAITSSCIIGTSFIFKKKGLIRLANKGLRAGAGGFGYLKDWMWWAGFLLMAIGEGANFVAFAFAPASLVTPLGAISVFVTALLSSRFLGDRLNLLGKLGCMLCVTGSTMVVLHSPKEQEVASMEALTPMLLEPAFVTYAIIVVVANIIFIFHFGPRFGSTNPLVYIVITGSMGSISVMGCKGLGVALKETIAGHNQMTNPVTWAMVLIVVFFLSIQMNYLNRALDIFSTSVVTPILYVFFTTFVIIASAILFKEWRGLTVPDCLGNLTGFATVVIGIFLLHGCKEVNISLSTLNVNVYRTPMVGETLSPEEPVHANGKALFVEP